MMFQSAHKTSLIFVALFLFVVGVVIFGSLYYKQSSAGLLLPFNNADSSTTQESVPTLSANLQLIPSNEEQTSYKIVISGLTQPISGVVFQLLNAPDGAEFTSNSIETDPALQSSGWSTAINSSTEVDSSQQLSFSMLLNSPGAVIEVPSFEIGTLEFNQTPAFNELSLIAEESYVTYNTDQTATLNLSLETDTIEN